MVLVEGRKWQGKGVGCDDSTKKCVHIFANAKLILVETIPDIGGGLDKGE
jgi:hypothetical protein